MTLPLALAFIVYFSLLLLIGVYCHKRQTTSAEFVMGNRSLNFWLVALSAHASDMSAWLFMAFPMTIFVLGMGQSWIAIGLLVGMFLNWQFVAPKLRIMTEKYNCYTMPSFFEKRFNDTSGTIGLLSAVATLIFMVFYLSAGMIAMGALLESLFGIEYLVGLSIAMLVIVIYTYIGGFTTVAWIDFFQAVFLLGVILLVPIVALSHVGGWEKVTAAAELKNITLSPLIPLDVESGLPIFLLALGWGVGYVGMPHIITKFMGINDPKHLVKAKWLGMSWQLLALGAAAFVGVVGIAFFPEGLANPELVFVEMVKMLFHPFVGGIILCAIIAANMSTMDSQILVCASIVSEDLYRRFWPKDSDKKVLNASRISVPIITLLALVMASGRSSTVMDAVSYAWSGLGSSFGPLVLMSLYSKSTTKAGAITGIIVGTVTVMIWPTLNPYVTNIKVMEMIPGFFLSLASIYFVSNFCSCECRTEVKAKE